MKEENLIIRPLIAIVALIVIFGTMFFPRELFWSATFVANFNLLPSQWNILGVVWLVGIFYIAYKHYYDNHEGMKYLHAFCFMFGILSGTFYYIAMDELSLLMFTLTRADVLFAVSRLMLIPDKLFRWFVSIPFCFGMLSKYLDFKHYFSMKKCLLIFVAIAAFHLITSITGVYSSRYASEWFNTVVFWFIYIPVYVFLGYLFNKHCMVKPK